MQPDDELRGLLRAVDHPTPNVAVADIMTIARQRAAVRRVRIAASTAALLLVAGAAYAMPGSPVRAWLRSLSDRAPEHPGTATVPPTDPGAGISLPAGRRLHIVFDQSVPGSVVHVLLTADTLVTIVAPTGTADFAAGTDRLRISNAQSATFEVRIPRDAPEVDISVGGALVFRKQGARIVTEATTSDGWRIPLGPR